MSLPPEFLYELHKHFTGDIRTDLASRILYSTDASIYQIEPLGVVCPRTQEELIAAVELTAKYKIPILPRGAGTSLAGQAIGEALILDCSRYLDSIIEINLDEQYAIVEPGLVLTTLNAAVTKHGLMFGPDPASAERATLGGVIANNATGAHSILYGMSADHLISADVIMADGSVGVLGERSSLDNPLIASLYSSALNIREKYVEAITTHWPRAWRNSAGYRLNYLLPWSPTKPSQWVGDYPANLAPGTWNLASLLAGSEGTLAIIRQAKINLVKKPKHTILAVLAYQSIVEACQDVPRLLTHHPSAVELIPQMILRLARDVPAAARQMGWIVGDPAAVLVVEFSGDQPSLLKEEALKVGEILTIAESKEAQAQIWNIRKVGLGILDWRPQSARPVAFIEDCAIPVDRLGEFVREVEKILEEYGTYGGIYAHASAGCLHIRPILDMKTGEGARAMRSIAEATLELTLRLGGAMSSEHGDGIARSEWLQKTYGDEVVNAMRSLKQAADPHNLLNPNKLFDAPKMDSNLRYDETFQPQAWPPVLDFTQRGGLIMSIEQCNGQGVCRKSAGVLCPSYQATREEMHSTRGRANLLRALITNNALRNTQQAAGTTYSVLRNDALTESVVQALDLCLACKGCKAECPSGVDMAKLKFEFQNQYYKTHLHPLRDYLFGYFHMVAAVASQAASLSNLVMENSMVKNLAAAMFKITARRPFPKFAARQARAKVQPSGEKIIFLSDAYSKYVEPEIEQAAFDVLSACGYEVQVLPVIGAGAALLSKGFLDATKRHVGKVLEALNQLDPQHEAVIVGVEPPELYCLKNEYVDILPEQKDEIAKHVAQTWLLDEFLLRSENFKQLVHQISYENNSRPKIKFQPHCHQRAEGPAEDGVASGAGATVDLLRVCGFDVELIDSGCCGMAGTFGYEAEHFQLSMKVAELKLFPYLRSAETQDAVIASTGAACRMQIEQGVKREVLHPILLIDQWLKSLP
jgi:FAD/FMN-containing dehydrogenase/Fe-S oxidoreductase